MEKLTLENITVQKLDWEYAQLKKQVKAVAELGTQEIWFAELSDDMLGIFIAGATWAYGRTFEKSIDNARSHMENRERAEYIFSRKSY